MPAIYISKYNRFVDNIIGRVNRILGKSYDPVRVKLPSNQKNANQNKNKGNGKKKNANKKKNTRSRADKVSNKMGELQIARASNEINDTGDAAHSTGMYVDINGIIQIFLL